MSTYLVIGASRGIGLELVKELLESYKDSKVIAAARQPHSAAGLQTLLSSFPSRLTLVTIDTGDSKSVQAAAESVTKSHPTGIDYIINNAAVIGERNTQPDDIVCTFNINVAGPIRVAQGFLSLLQKGTKKVLVNVSSPAETRDRNLIMYPFLNFAIGILSPQVQQAVDQFFHTLGEGAAFHGYRVSKAALNCLSIIQSLEYAKDGVTVISLHPGSVATDMLWSCGATPETATQLGAISPKESAVKQLETVHKLTIADSGKFYSYAGEVMQY